MRQTIIWHFLVLFACREEKSLRHVAMVARLLDLMKLWSCKYGRKKTTKLTCMTFLCMVEFMQEQNGSPYVSSIIRQCKCPSLSRKIVEIQKYGCHVNVTSHFSLFSYLSTLQLWWKPKKTADISRHHCRMFSQASRDVKKCYLQTLSTQKSRGIQTVLSKLRDATASTSGTLYSWSTFNGPFQIHSVFSAFEKDQL